MGAVPVIDQELCVLSIVGSLREHVDIAPQQLDHVVLTLCHFQAIPASKVQVCLTGNVSPWRCQGLESLEVIELSEYPCGTFVHARQYFLHIPAYGCDDRDGTIGMVPIPL